MKNVIAKVEATNYQRQFLRTDYYTDIDGILRDRTKRNKGLIGGFGTGKTYSLCIKVLQQVLFRHAQKVPHIGIYTAPVHSHFVDVVRPQIETLLDKYKFKWNYHGTDKIYTIRIGTIKHLIHLKSGEQAKQGKIVGINATDCYHDEFDVNKVEVQKKIWESTEARLRDCKDPTQSIGTTPEKLGFTHWLCDRSKFERFDGTRYKQEQCSIVEYIRAKTIDNIFLKDPIGYVNKLKNLYTPKQIQSYLNGFFVNMIGNRVWEYFDEELHVYEKKLTGSIVTGWDFGWNDPFYFFFASIDHTGHVHIFEEYQANKTVTEDIILNYKARCKKHNVRPIIDYCDPAGNQHHETTGVSNIEMMEANKLNPVWTSSRIMEGIIIGNNLLHKNRVSVSKNCPLFIQMMINSSYPEPKNGVVSETPVHDQFSHPESAFRYMCVGEFREDYKMWGNI